MKTKSNMTVDKKQTKKRKVWECKDCGEIFKSKADLVEHLIEAFDDYTQSADICECQLEDLNVKNY